MVDQISSYLSGFHKCLSKFRKCLSKSRKNGGAFRELLSKSRKCTRTLHIFNKILPFNIGVNYCIVRETTRLIGAHMRINKYISETGFCSRRATNRLIEEKRITVNGIVCEAGARIDAGDIVLIDGKIIPKKAEPVYIVLHKPVGITCTAARTVKGNIIDFMDYPTRIFPIGRLDKDSEGLILMTNDGDIVNKMMRSEFGHEKEYVVTVDTPITNAFIKKMSEGVEILGTTTKPCKVTRISDDKFRIILTQGLNRQIRRMAKECGYRVIRLERVRIMNIKDEKLAEGTWRELTKTELKNMLIALG